MFDCLSLLLLYFYHTKSSCNGMTVVVSSCVCLLESSLLVSADWSRLLVSADWSRLFLCFNDKSRVFFYSMNGNVFLFVMTNGVVFLGRDPSGV